MCVNVSETAGQNVFSVKLINMLCVYKEMFADVTVRAFKPLVDKWSKCLPFNLGAVELLMY